MPLTFAEVREHVDTDLSDAALQRLIDAAYTAIEEAAGPEGERTEIHRGLGRFVHLHQTAGTVSIVTELRGTTTETLVAGTDFRVRFSGRALERLTDGQPFWRRWGREVTVTYTPKASATATRDRVAVDLVKLSLRHSGLRSERIGQYSYTTAGGDGGYQAERERILAGLVKSGGTSLR